MNVLVSMRNNTTGILSPTPADRTKVSETLATTAAAREGKSTVEVTPEITQTAKANHVTGTTSNGVSSSGNVTENDLGKDAFLQLLVLQMQNQDPFEPVSNTEMLAQLAQFSSLEAQTNLNESFIQMSSNLDQLNFMSASQMLGRYVEGVDIDGNLHAGIVESVHLDGSLVVLNVDGKFMSMAGILRIEETAPNTIIQKPAT